MNTFIYVVYVFTISFLLSYFVGQFHGAEAVIGMVYGTVLGIFSQIMYNVLMK